MIRKIFLFVWCICVFSLTKAGNFNESNISSTALQEDSLDSIKYFPSVEVYYGLLGSIPFTSLNFEPTILENNKYFINLRLSHSYWLSERFSFFQTSLLAGIRPNSSFKPFIGINAKSSLYSTGQILKNKNYSTDIFANIGFEYITKFNIFFKFNIYKYLYTFNPILHNYDFYPYLIPVYGTYHSYKTPYAPFDIGIGYIFSKSKFKYSNKIFNYPKNTFSLTYGLQFPRFLLRFEHQLFNVGKYALLANIGYRYGKYREPYGWNNTYKIDIKNMQLGLNFKTIIMPHVSWYFGFTNGYYYVVDNDKPSYFNEIAARTGLSFLLGKHLQIQYFVYFPFYFYNVQPKLRTEYYLPYYDLISNSKISIGYSFGYKKH